MIIMSTITTSPNHSDGFATLLSPQSLCRYLLSFVSCGFLPLWIPFQTDPLPNVGRIVRSHAMYINRGVQVGERRAANEARSSNADGTLTVLHQDSPDQYHVLGNLETPQGSRNMGLDPQPPRVCRFREVWAGACGWEGQRTRATRNIHFDGDRAGPSGALTVDGRG